MTYQVPDDYIDDYTQTIDEESQEEQFQNMVMRLAIDPTTILPSLTPEKLALLHAVVGIAGEAGELLDAVKKHIYYQQPLNVENVLEEMGDIEFYQEMARQAIGVTRNEIIGGNIDKLLTGENARYKEGEFSNEAASARRDKQLTGETFSPNPDGSISSEVYEALLAQAEKLAQIQQHFPGYSPEDYAGLKASQERLRKLEEGGVDNWMGYDEALNS